MATFHVEIATDNDAFQPEPFDEVADLLSEASRRVRGGRTSGPLHDVNGNQVGTYWFEEDQ